MALDPRLRSYIWQQLNKGYTPESIEYVLVKTGYDPETARSSVDAVQGEMEARTPPMPRSQPQAAPKPEPVKQIAPTVRAENEEANLKKKRTNKKIILVMAVLVALIGIVLIMVYMDVIPGLEETESTTTTRPAPQTPVVETKPEVETTPTQPETTEPETEEEKTSTVSASYVGFENVALGNFQITGNGKASCQVVNIDSEKRAMTMTSITVDAAECSGAVGLREYQRSWSIECEGTREGTQGSVYVSIPVVVKYTIDGMGQTETGSVSGRYA
jgi:hypothetical protein